MWITKDINIPDEVLEAQKKGELVIFAGAGISTPPPANLPSFEKLAIDISQGLIPYDKSTSIDTFLGRLSNGGVGVHKKAIELLTIPESEPSSYHKNILKLFSKNQTRIVTTNFDDHFNKASNNHELSFYYAPALPLGRDFSGVIHLHGSVNKSPKELVLTDSDFGRAYFTDGWATNFLRGMFSNYVVLFIGFSANDPVMKYIATGLNSNNRNRYAFTEEGLSDHWNHLQIKTIEYPEKKHELLEAAIESWVDRTQMGVFEQRKQIKDIVEQPPEYNEVDESYIEDQLKSKIGARHFFDLAKDFEWVEWMIRNQMLDNLFISESPKYEFNRMQGVWFSSFIVTQSERMMAIIMEKGGGSELLKHSINREIYRRAPELSSKSIGKWLPILLNHINFTKKVDSLEYIATKLNYPQDKETILVLMDNLTRPITTYKRKFSITEADDELVTIDIDIKGDSYWLEKVWENLIEPNLDYYSMPILNIFINQIQMITYLLKTTGHEAWDPISFSRSAIEPHEQDKYPENTDFLIDKCRDTLKYLIMTDSSLAQTYIQQCLLSESQILNRIAIYGYMLIEESNFDKKLNWLIKNNLLFKIEYKHEVYQFIKEVYPGLSEDSRKRFLEYIENTLEDKKLAQPSNKELWEYEKFNLFYWITTADENCEKALKAFRVLNQKNSFVIREYPDFTHWTSTGGVSTQKIEITEGEIKSRNPRKKKDLDWLINYNENVEKDSFFGKREQFLNLISSTVEKNKLWRWKLINAISDDKIKQDTDLWSAILRGLSEVNLSDKELLKLSKSIYHFCDIKVYRNEISHFYNNVSRFQFNNFQGIIGCIIEIYDLIFNSFQRSEIIENKSPYIAAINHPIGKLTEFFYFVYTKSFNDDDNCILVMKEIKDNVFSKLFDNKVEQALVGKMILAKHIHALMTIDEKWFTQELIPLFNTTNDIEIAKKMWDAYVHGGRWNERLLKSLFEGLEKILSITEELNEVTQEGIYRLCVSILFYSPGYSKQLKNYFLEAGTNQQFEQLINHIAIILRQLDEKAITKAWEEWLKDYLYLRLNNLPIASNDMENKKLVSLFVPLEPVIKEYTKLLNDANELEKDNALNIIYEIYQSEIAHRHPYLLLEYLEFILRNIDWEDTDINVYSNELFDVLEQIYEFLEEEDSNFPLILEQVASLNIPRATELLSNYNNSFHR
ncbi:SIR2 family protein [Guptibacillus sedimenti]|uniref:SIR2 family protein n=1 Tax=Guptibacillus sedimenti TaxID=3025680 RepID=UPI00235F55C4|nr:SIR2 family protein [Pseudalkalibacillus sedimenti]